MAFNLKKFFEGLKIIPKASTTIDAMGEMEVLSASGKLNYHNGSSASPMVTEAHTATLTNKTLTSPVINGATFDSITVPDSGFTIQDNGDATKQLKFQASGITTATTRTLTAPDANTTIVGTDATQTLTNKTLSGNIATNLISGAATVTLPTTTSTLSTLALSETLTNKTLTSPVINTPTLTVLDSALTIQDNGDPTKQLQFQVSGITTGTTRTLTAPDFSDTIAGVGGIQTFANKTISSSNNTITLVDTSISIKDSGDLTKQILFDAGGTASTSTTIAAAQTANRVVTMPDATTTLVGTGATQTLSAKTFSDPVTIAELATPSTPASGFGKVYFKTDGNLYQLNDGGTETNLASGGGSSSLTVQTKTANYTILSTDDVIFADATSGNITMTLPLANAVTKIYYIQKKDTTFNTVSLATSGGDTAPFDTTLRTQNEIIAIIPDSGTSYRMMIHRAPSSFIFNYTPTTTQGFGTISGSELWYVRMGEFVRFGGIFTVGTPTASEARIGFPTGMPNSNASPAQIYRCGSAVTNDNTTTTYYVLIEPSTGYFTFGQQPAASGGMAKVLGNTFTPGSKISFEAIVPIAGWSG